jgi:hypothetical protein
MFTPTWDFIPDHSFLYDIKYVIMYVIGSHYIDYSFSIANKFFVISIIILRLKI